MGGNQKSQRDGTRVCAPVRYLLANGTPSNNTATVKTRPDGRWWALLALLMLVAHASSFGVGPVGEDFSILADISRAVAPGDGGSLVWSSDLFYELAGSAGRPLAALSLGLTCWLWTADGHWTPFALALLRFENIALLAGGAWALASFLRRLVSPWGGSEQANAAGQAAMMLLLVHPLAVTTVAGPTARGDLIGALFALAAGAAFLRGRQEHSKGFVLLAAPLVFLATLASEIGFLMPLALGAAEYISSRRYRSMRVRVRTGLTTLICFGACAGLDVAMRLALRVDPWPRWIEESLGSLTTFGDFWVSLLSGLTKLGVLILPVNGENAGGMGFVLAAFLLVIVIQPALHAGKAAPRYWISILCAWLASILLAEAVRAGLRVGPNDFSDVAGLFPAVIVMTMGLALASTAVSGGRRVAIPIIVACLLCTLARNNARGWRQAAKDAAGLTEEMLPIVLAQDAPHTFLVVDAPDMVDLFAACPADMTRLFERAITGQTLTHAPTQVRPLSRDALMSFARLSEFDELREGQALVVFPLDYVQPWAQRRWVAQALSPGGTSHRAQRWNHYAPGAGPEQHNLSASHWAEENGMPLAFADPSGIECLTVQAPAMLAGEDMSTHERTLAAPEIYWRAQGGTVHGGVLHGVWLSDADHRMAVFDPGQDLPWLLGNRVDSLLLMGELAQAQGAELWPSPPQIVEMLEPAIDDDDWHLGRPAVRLKFGAGLLESWRLTLFDLVTWEYEVIECVLDGRGDLMAPDAEEISQGLRFEPGSLAWTVERRVGDVVIERGTGRL